MMVDPPVATEEHKTGKQVRYLTCTRPNSSVADDNDDDAHRVRRRFCRSVTISRADGGWLRAREISLSVTAEIGSEGDALGLFLLVLLLFVRGENRGRSDSSKALNLQFWHEGSSLSRPSPWHLRHSRGTTGQ